MKRSPSPTGPFTIVAPAVTENRWVDATAAAGTTSYYLVTSLMESVPSSQATATVTAPLSAAVNFQPSGFPVPAGYTADTGELYGVRSGGLSYGWSTDHTTETRDRGGSTDPRLATLIQLHAGARWQMAVPNGSYSVTVGVGDGGFSSTYTLNVEGTAFWSNTALAPGEFVTQTRTVTVQDGQLTLDPGNAAEEATRINYLVLQGL